MPSGTASGRSELEKPLMVAKRRSTAEKALSSNPSLMPARRGANVVSSKAAARSTEASMER